MRTREEQWPGSGGADDDVSTAYLWDYTMRNQIPASARAMGLTEHSSIKQIRALPHPEFRSFIRSNPRYFQRYTADEMHRAKEDRRAYDFEHVLPEWFRPEAFGYSDDDMDWAATFFRGGLMFEDFLRGVWHEDVDQAKHILWCYHTKFSGFVVEIRNHINGSR